MATIDKLWLVTLTRNKDNAETDAGSLNVTINIDGNDVNDMQFGFSSSSGWFSDIGPDDAWLDEGQAAISGTGFKNAGVPVQNTFDTSRLTNSSIRVGIRSDDAWSPQHLMLLGNIPADPKRPTEVVALGLETDINNSLSTDSSEGKLSMPLRLVSSGNDNTVINRVMLLVYTAGDNDTQTDSPVQLQITANGGLAVQQQIPDTPQDDFEGYTGNWYFINALTPFTRGQIRSNGGIELSILGTDAWVPSLVFVFGLDTKTGRPNTVVPLVSIPEWSLGTLSTDSEEGNAAVSLPLVGSSNFTDVNTNTNATTLTI
jgi:hypothetical protein